MHLCDNRYYMCMNNDITFYKFFDHPIALSQVIIMKKKIHMHVQLLLKRQHDEYSTLIQGPFPMS